jgi:hypothetical protein
VTCHYYIYYRVAEPVTDATRSAVHAILAEVKRETGVLGRLMMRTDDPATWMEIYEGVTREAQFEQALAAAVEHAGVARILAADSHRHIERFRPL